MPPSPEAESSEFSNNELEYADDMFSDHKFETTGTDECDLKHAPKHPANCGGGSSAGLATSVMAKGEEGGRGSKPSALSKTRVIELVADEKKLNHEKRPGEPMYVDDLAEYLHVLLAMNGMEFLVSWLRGELILFCQVTGITGSQPDALTQLQYHGMELTLVRDPHFSVPPLPHAFLLGLLFHIQAFKSQGIKHPEDLYSLRVLNGLNQQKLSLHDDLTDQFIFCSTVHERDTICITHEIRLTTASVQTQMKKSGEIIGFQQVTKLYVLCDAVVKGFNKSRECLTHLPWPQTAEGADEGGVLDELVHQLLLTLEADAGAVEIGKPPGAHSEDFRMIIIDAALMLPLKTPEAELQRRITALHTVSAYCGAEEGPLCRRRGYGSKPRPTTVELTAVKAGVMDQPLSTALLESSVQEVRTERGSDQTLPEAACEEVSADGLQNLQCGAKNPERYLLLLEECAHGTITHSPKYRMLAQSATRVGTSEPSAPGGCLPPGSQPSWFSPGNEGKRGVSCVPESPHSSYGSFTIPPVLQYLLVDICMQLLIIISISPRSFGPRDEAVKA
ncbi:hypothetical protein PAAG_08068 [Paracoccidioides lutzii Pb01]|uniref:Uncharacterized protein n=1 Tax=Paracoccidioides lutzii (strain ATCC MYA-826 / Pb01) TaxID=502779 RepID=C1HBC7_PARBA|nr:hypothetical protein PAAG_08068 [Paracoccidioides lutzii Pb01]EEH37650.2 hypothetical protein PAAG_08068 [Paracoccidioides lutzii Pb01]